MCWRYLNKVCDYYYLTPLGFAAFILFLGGTERSRAVQAQDVTK